MSTFATRMPYAFAERKADFLSALLADACESLVVCGSVRRRAATVGDVEIVAVPKLATYTQADLFGETISTTTIDLLGSRLDTLVDDGVISRRPRHDGKLAWGPHAKALTFEGIPVDLYTPEKERAGWIVLLRTGPAAFARQLVVERPLRPSAPLGMAQGKPGEPTRRTSDGRLGLLPPTVRSIDGWLCDRVSGRRLETPTERDAFDALELAYLEPWERT